MFEDAAQGEALHLHGEEGLVDVAAGEVGEGGEVGGGGGAEELEVALGESVAVRGFCCVWSVVRECQDCGPRLRAALRSG